jgi:hypothetical protein
MRALYDEILRIARNYMGPAAEDYIRRRIRIVQGGRDPESIEPDKIARLAAGIEMTGAIYVTEPKARAFRDEILALRARFEKRSESS